MVLLEVVHANSLLFSRQPASLVVRQLSCFAESSWLLVIGYYISLFRIDELCGIDFRNCTAGEELIQYLPFLDAQIPKEFSIKGQYLIGRWWVGVETVLSRSGFALCASARVRVALFGSEATHTTRMSEAFRDEVPLRKLSEAELDGAKRPIQRGWAKLLGTKSR